MVIETPEVEVVVSGARNLPVEAGKQPIDRLALSRRRGASDPDLIHWIENAGLDLAIHHRKIPASDIDTQEVEQLVLDDRSADGSAGLDAVLRRVKRREGVLGVEAGATQKVKNIAVGFVGAALGDRVHHATHGASVFRGEIGADHLKFLYRVLRDLRLNARTAGILVIELLGVVVTIQQE